MITGNGQYSGKIVHRHLWQQKTTVPAPPYGWHGNTMGTALGLQSTGRGFKYYLGKSCVTTLGKLLTPMYLCHQAV